MTRARVRRRWRERERARASRTGSARRASRRSCRILGPSSSSSGCMPCAVRPPFLSSHCRRRRRRPRSSLTRSTSARRQDDRVGLVERAPLLGRGGVRGAAVVHPVVTVQRASSSVFTRDLPRLLLVVVVPLESGPPLSEEAKRACNLQEPRVAMRVRERQRCSFRGECPSETRRRKVRRRRRRRRGGEGPARRPRSRRLPLSRVCGCTSLFGRTAVVVPPSLCTPAPSSALPERHPPPPPPADDIVVPPANLSLDTSRHRVLSLAAFTYSPSGSTPAVAPPPSRRHDAVDLRTRARPGPPLARVALL